MEKSASEKRKAAPGRVHFIVMNVVRVLLLLAAVGAYFNERWLVFFVAVFAIVVTFIPRLLERKWGIEIPAEFEVLILLFIYGTLFFGEVQGFYAAFWWWGILLKLVASIALGLIGFTILYVLYRDEKIDASPVMIAFFAFCFAVAIGALWEIFEFGIDKFFGFQMQKAGSGDTTIDLIANAVGALLVSIAGYFYIKGARINIVSKFITNFIEKNPSFFRSRESAESVSNRLKKLIDQGESEKLEFKSTLRTNVHTGEMDKKVEHGVLKTIVAFLNSNGGTLLIGVSDDGRVFGIEKDKFLNNDRMGLHFTNLLKHSIGSEYLPLIHFELIPIEEKTVLKVDVRESDKPVFLKTQGEEEFFVRNGPSSGKLTGSALIDYVKRRFGEK